MDNKILHATPRSSKGKGPARQLRMNGGVPGVFYYRGQDTVSFTVDRHELLSLLRAKLTLLKLEIDGQKPRECIIRDLQLDPVSDDIMHIDLMGIKRGQKLTVTVPIHVEGTPVGVKTGGGILEKGLGELDIECLPKDIPNAIVVDVSGLDVGQSIHINELDYPQFRFLDDEKIVLATVVSPSIAKAPEEETEEEEPEAEEGDDELEETED